MLLSAVTDRLPRSGGRVRLLRNLNGMMRGARGCLQLQLRARGAAAFFPIRLEWKDAAVTWAVPHAVASYFQGDPAGGCVRHAMPPVEAEGTRRTSYPRGF